MQTTKQLEWKWEWKKILIAVVVMIIITIIIFISIKGPFQTYIDFLTSFGDIIIATSPPDVTAADFRAAMALAKAGDIVCVSSDSYLVGYFIPGKYTHSGIMISDSLIMDAVAEGVHKKDILEFIRNTDRFIILRPQYSNDEAKQKTVDFALGQEGKPYDFLFDSKDDSSYYCHEFPVRCLKEAAIIVNNKSNVYLAEDFVVISDIVYETGVEKKMTMLKMKLRSGILTSIYDKKPTKIYKVYRVKRIRT